MSILNDVRLNIGDDDGTAASGTFGSSSFVSVSGSANLLGDIRVNIGDDSETGGGGQLAGSHYLLSSTHLDTVPGTPTSPSVIVSLSGTNLWAILPGTTDGTVLSYTSGSIQFIPIAGVSGVQGPAGPAGPSGAIGPSGETGPQGPAGPSGAQGIQGIQGPSGVAGPSGATGAQGPQGDVGPSGATGPSGLPGQDGATGPQGPPGPIVGWSGVLSVNNWSGPYSPVAQNKFYGLDDIHIASGNQLIWAVNASGNEVAGVLASGSGFIKITDGRDGVGHIIFNSRMPSVWDPLPYDITQALDWLAIATGIPGPSGATGPQGPQGPSGVAGPSGATGADGATGATGPQGPPGPIVGWSGVLNVNNWSGPHDVIIEQPARLFDDLIIASGQPILWSNTSNPSGGFQVGIVSSGSGLLKITDGWVGAGHILFNSKESAVWTPYPIDITTALDYLARATGVLAGNSGNPIQPTEPLNQTLVAGNWSGPVPIVAQHAIYAGSGINIASGSPILWSNVLSPSGGPQVGILPSGSGVIKITDGYSGQGYIFYSPSVPTNWSAPAPATIESALDALVKATGILAGGTGNPPVITEGLAETTSAGNWSSITDIVTLGRAVVSGNILLPSSGLFVWSSNVDPSGTPKVLIYSPGAGLVQVSGHIVYVPSTPGDWNTGVPSTITQALDFLAAATGQGGGGSQPQTLNQVLSRGNWSGPIPIVSEHAIYSQSGVFVASGVQIKWSNILSPSGGPQLGIVSSGSGMLKITDGNVGNGHLLFFSRNPGLWGSLPSDVTSALDMLAANSGDIVGLTNISGLSEVLTRGNWGGTTPIVTEASVHISGSPIVSSGQQILWSNRAIPSGGYQLGIMASGSGILKVTDGWSGYGKIYYSPGNVNDWSAPSPVTIESALDSLVKATGILAGGTGNPPRIIDGLSETTNAGNWSSVTSVVTLGNAVTSGNLLVPTSGLITWSSTTNPSGSPKVLIYSPDVGLVQISGHLVYVPTTSADWTQIPTTVTNALDQLAKATGVLAGNSGNPIQPVEALNQTLVAGNWSGPVPIVAQHAVYANSGLYIPSGVPIEWSNVSSASGDPQVGIIPSGSGFIKITDGHVGNGHLLFFSRNQGLWPVLPTDITQALDLLAANSGDIVGLTSISGLSEVLTRGNWGGLLPIVTEASIHISGSPIIGSGQAILWSNRAIPSGGYQAGILPSGSGFLKITDGSNGLGHIIYSPSNPNDWSVPIPNNIDSALDALVKATGILAGGTGNPPRIIDGLSETLIAGNWGGLTSFVLESNTHVSGNNIVGSGSSILWTNRAQPSGGYQLGLAASGSGILRISDGWSGDGYIFYSPTTPGDWDTGIPATIERALDLLAAATGQGDGGGPSTDGLSEVVSRGNWSGPQKVVFQSGMLSSNEIVLISGVQLKFTNTIDSGSLRSVGLDVHAPGILKITDADANLGSLLVNSNSIYLGTTLPTGISISAPTNVIMAVRAADGNPAHISVPGSGASSEQFGYRANAQGANSTSVGRFAISSGSRSVAIGENASSLGSNNIIIGNDARSDLAESNSVIIGTNAAAESQAVVIGCVASGDSGDGSVIIGYDGKATQFAVAIGHKARALGGSTWGIAIGEQSSSAAGIAIGRVASVGNGVVGIGHEIIGDANSDTILIGNNAFCSGVNNDANVVIGNRATTSGTSNGTSVCIGHDSILSADDMIIIGNRAVGNGDRSIVIGKNSNVDAAFDTILIGQGTYARNTSSQSISIGSIAHCQEDNSVTIGFAATGISERSVNIGSLSIASGQRAIAMGHNCAVSNSNSIAVGANISLTQRDSVVIGYSAGAPDNESVIIGTLASGGSNAGSIAIGYDAKSAGSAIGLGYKARATSSDAVAIGRIASAAGNTIAIGSLSSAADESIAIGKGAIGSTESIVIGDNALNSGVNNSNNILIGDRASVSGTSRNTSICIGYDSSFAADNSITIGNAAYGYGTNSIGIGANLSIINASNAVAIGNKAYLPGNASNSVAIGALAYSAENDNVVVGYNATGILDSSIAIGSTSISSGLRSIAIGTRATNIATNSIAIGAFAYVDNEALNSIAIGFEAVAVTSPGDTGQIAIGYQASGLANKGIAIGYLATTKINSDSSIAIGNTTSAEGVNNTVVGSTCRSIGNNCIVIGNDSAFSDGGTNIAIGRGAVGGFGNTCDNNIAIGPFAVATSGSGSDKNIAIGVFARNLGANTLSTIAIGEMAHNNADNSIAIGGFSQTSGVINAIALGYEATSLAQRSISIGYRAYNRRFDGIAIGSESLVGSVASSGIAIGSSAVTSGNNSIAIGPRANAISTNSIAIGPDAKVKSLTASGSIAIGNNAVGSSDSVTSFNNISIGSYAYSSGANYFDNIAIGNYSNRGNDSGGVSRSIFIGSHNKGTTGALANVASIILIGSSSTANGGETIIIGNDSTSAVLGESGIIIGNNSKLNGDRAISIGTNANAFGGDSIAIGQNAATTTNNAFALGLQARASHIGAAAIGFRSVSIARQVYTFGSDSIGISLHAPSGYLRIGHLHGDAVLASGDVWAGGHNQSWLWYNQDSGSLRVADNQGNGIIELNAIQQRVVVSGDIVYTGTRIAGTDVFTTSATVRREFSIFRHGASVWPVASLPSAPESGVVHTIKDGAGLAVTNNIMVSGVGKTIDGQNGIPIVNNYGSLTVVYNGTEWSVT